MGSGLALAAAVLAASALLAEDSPLVVPGSVVRWHADGAQTCHLGERSWGAEAGTCFLPIDLLATGELTVMRTFADGRCERRRLHVGPYPYPTQRLAIPDDRKVNPLPEDERRIAAENQRIAAVYQREADPARFALPLGKPLARLPAGGRFGSRRVLNGQPRSPHGGADYSVARGTPVLAADRGQVALAEEHFFGGNSVFLDHGSGLITVYLHLDRIDVAPGSRVSRGQRLGTVGATGRATGPHLHFAVRWHGQRVDPALLLGAPNVLPTLP